MVFYKIYQEVINNFDFIRWLSYQTKNMDFAVVHVGLLYWIVKKTSQVVCQEAGCAWLDCCWSSTTMDGHRSLVQVKLFEKPNFFGINCSTSKRNNCFFTFFMFQKDHIFGINTNLWFSWQLYSRSSKRHRLPWEVFSTWLGFATSFDCTCRHDMQNTTQVKLKGM